MTNSADTDHLASSEANWSGSTLFAKTGHVVFSKGRVNNLCIFLDPSQKRTFFNIMYIIRIICQMILKWSYCTIFQVEQKRKQLNNLLMQHLGPFKKSKAKVDWMIRKLLHKIVWYWYSLEMPQWGTSDENPQHMFPWRNKKIVSSWKIDLNIKVCLIFVGLRARMAAGYTMMNDLTVIQATQVRWTRPVIGGAYGYI